MEQRRLSHSLTTLALVLAFVPVAVSPAAAGGGHGGSTTSNNNVTSTSPPTISGSAVQGQTLSASTGSWSGGANSFAYSWQRCASGSCAGISGAGSSTYVLTSSDVGDTIQVVVTASSKQHGSASATSAAVGPVAPAPSSTPPPPAPTAPAATSPPSVSGTAMEGYTLTGTAGTWSGSPTSYSYSWLRCDTSGGNCSPFTAGGGLTYTLSLLDVGSTIRLAVTATNGAGSTTATSNATGIVAPPPAPSPAVAISAPAAGATISGSVPFTATVANATPTSVVFTIDGGSQFTEYQSPYVYNGDGNTLDTTKLANGTHTLAARAYLSDGTSVAASIQVTVQNTLTAPTAPTTNAKGIGVLRFGTSYTSGSNYNSYDSIFVGYGDAASAGALTARSLVYKGGVDVTDSPNTDPGANMAGVPYKQALANGWLLKDSSGNYLKAVSYGNWLGDVGDPNFQKAWVDNVSTFLKKNGDDGVFIDNVLCSIGQLTNNVMPAKYPTASSWADAQAAFLAYVGPAMKSLGLYVAVNAYCYGPDNGSANTAWWTRIAPYVDGLMTEDFEQNPGNLSQLFFNAPTVSWMGNWLGKLDVIKAAQSAGKDAYALSYGSSTDTRLMTYTKASYLMVWNGKGGGFIFNTLDGSDPWNVAWTSVVGAPTGAMTQVGNAFVRDFTGGYVVVNPSQSSVTVSLPAGLKTTSGAAAGSSVTLATTTAAIFLK